MTILITGIAGFVGQHMLTWCETERADAERVGFIQPGWPVPAGLAARARLIEVDLGSQAAVAAAFDQVRPTHIVHLAAQSSPQQSWRDPTGTMHVNVFGLLYMLEALKERDLNPRVVVVGSAEEYGLASPEQMPLTEDAPLRPATPYAASKVAQGFVALQYAVGCNMETLRTRAFHHTGAGRGENFAESSFARQIVEIELGLRDAVIDVGNLEGVRDYSDVRDVVRAYGLLLERGARGEVYNVCSGQGIRMRALLERLIAISGVAAEIRVDPARLRPLDLPVLIGDASRLRQATGWAPRHAIDETLRQLIEHWRARVRAEREARA
ncbi:MAG: GDP-mannose 4,6-dehydratase [Vicinamibacteria bacterium]|nr:GDP-mannose 4,6-dehydratase [Vicinamibacteria bacterium]